MPSLENAVARHYNRPNLLAMIDDALRAAGKDPGKITSDDLAAIDQFHIGGKAATLELARLAEIKPGESVLDVGGGFGGPARTLAGQLGCSVMVVDLSEEYVRLGAVLTSRLGLSGRVEFVQGDAAHLPYPERTFDVVWTQHSSMNIPDKRALHWQLHRVLRRGGRLAMHEITAGAVQPIHFPVPWASQPDASFLESAEAHRSLIRATGFRELAWRDVTRSALDWFHEGMAAAKTRGRAALGVHLLLGNHFQAAFQNQIRNLEEGRIVVVEGVFEK